MAHSDIALSHSGHAVEGASQPSSTQKSHSVEDQKALKVIRDATKVNGHYYIPIPYKDERAMPNNKSLTKKRREDLGRRLERNHALQKACLESMQALMGKGHAEVPEDQKAGGHGEWCIPHHALINENKKMVHIVLFICAARYQGTPLNDRVSPSPSLINGLLALLLRLRQLPIAVPANIEAMFYQVGMPAKNRGVLRFLWWPEGMSPNH